MNTLKQYTVGAGSCECHYDDRYVESYKKCYPNVSLLTNLSIVVIGNYRLFLCACTYIYICIAEL